MPMEEECTYEIPECVSPSSIDAEEDMITLETVSPNVAPTCVVPEVMTASQATNLTTKHADAGIENLLKSLETREEKMMLLHQERHDQIIAVHGKLLSELMTIKDIMQHTNDLLFTHNGFMGSIAQSLKNKVDRENAQTSGSTTTPPQVAQRHIPLASQSLLVGEVADISHITPHPVHTTVPLKENPCEGVHTYAENTTDRRNNQKLHPCQTARECPQQLFIDEFRHETVVDTFHSVNFVPAQQKGTPGHMHARGLGRRCRKGSYSRGRGRNLQTSTYTSGGGNMSPFVPPKESNMAYTKASTVNRGKRREIQRYTDFKIMNLLCHTTFRPTGLFQVTRHTQMRVYLVYIPSNINQTSEKTSENSYIITPAAPSPLPLISAISMHSQNSP
ncbi:uncharacterized protein LOC142489225 [Ascaphus truei]|uniref:uncharacterized protein LOC142489225 n=1 Tax=Ascaphus truei TaxID=8439 RepID=UPI003F597F14